MVFGMDAGGADQEVVVPAIDDAERVVALVSLRSVRRRPSCLSGASCLTGKPVIASGGRGRFIFLNRAIISGVHTGMPADPPKAERGPLKAALARRSASSAAASSAPVA